MLNQLTRLSVDADGRYATAEELQFLKDYLASTESRISAYEKIRDAEDEIMDQLEAEARTKNPHVFMKGSEDMTPVCRRDRKHLLKCAAAAMLIDDLDRLRDGLLMWQRTIIHAMKDEQASQLICRLLPNVIKQHLTPEEEAIMMPALRLNQALLG
jgi:hypothetical protein